MRYTRFELPTKPYLKKFIIVNDGDPIYVTKASKSNLGKLFSVLGSQNVHCGLSSYNINSRLQYFTDKIFFDVAIGLSGNITSPIDNHKIIELNRFAESYFVEELYSHCFYSIDHKIRYSGYHNAFLSFREIYNLTDADITLGALKKMEYRKRKLREKRLCQNIKFEK